MSDATQAKFAWVDGDVVIEDDDRPGDDEDSLDDELRALSEDKEDADEIGHSDSLDIDQRIDALEARVYPVNRADSSRRARAVLALHKTNPGAVGGAPGHRRTTGLT